MYGFKAFVFDGKKTARKASTHSRITPRSTSGSTTSPRCRGASMAPSGFIAPGLKTIATSGRVPASAR